MVTEQATLYKELSRLFKIYYNSEGAIRPHFTLTGSSGSGKSHLIKTLCNDHDIAYVEINAAQLTKEGTSGNSLSKALSQLGGYAQTPVVCFVDEFDKLFISGNYNNQHAQAYTTDVQNEFLKVLEADHTQVFGDYGKYVNIQVSHVLFVFAGAFNGEQDMTLDKMRDFGVKTEFLGRVGLVYSTTDLSLASLIQILENSVTLQNFLTLFPEVKKDDVVATITTHLTANYEKNTLGVRYIDSLIMQYFIKGGELEEKVVKQMSFTKTMSLED